MVTLQVTSGRTLGVQEGEVVDPQLCPTDGAAPCVRSTSGVRPDVRPISRLAALRSPKAIAR